MEPRLAAVVLVLSELFMLCPVKMCYEPGNNYSASIYTVTDPAGSGTVIFQVKTTLSLTVLAPSIRLRRFSFRDTELKQ